MLLLTEPLDARIYKWLCRRLLLVAWSGGTVGANIKLMAPDAPEDSPLPILHARVEILSSYPPGCHFPTDMKGTNPVVAFCHMKLFLLFCDKHADSSCCSCTNNLQPESGEINLREKRGLCDSAARSETSARIPGLAEMHCRCKFCHLWLGG